MKHLLHKCVPNRCRSKCVSFTLFVLFIFFSSLPYFILSLMNRSFDITKSKNFGADNTESFLKNNPDFCSSRINLVTKRNADPENKHCPRNLNLSIEEENKKSLQQLEEMTQIQLHTLQNPKDCKNRRILVCILTWKPGFGSLVHYLAECLLLALGTNRTMVTELSGWWYRNVEGVFESFSSCEGTDLSTAVEWKGRTSLTSEIDKHRVIKLYIARRRPYSSFVPFNMPKILADQLECSHNEPNAWWMGQVIKYLMRIKPWVVEKIEEAKRVTHFSHPIVGIHVRRMDKHGEARFFRLESYMAYVDRWFDCNYSNKGIDVTRRVYIATDEPSVIKEAKEKYKNYQVLHDPLFIRHRKMWWNRFTDDGSVGVLTDVQLLRECDYFVGTYSSNLGRLVHELKQCEKDSTFESVSLDNRYFYHNGALIRHIVVEDHSPHDGEIELKIGDEINVDIFYTSSTKGRGTNQRTRTRGTYPIWKVRTKADVAAYAGFIT